MVGLFYLITLIFLPGYRFIMVGKNTLIAYMLWSFGGLFGLHLLYLRRDSQAFIYWCTLGGYFGIGPFRDLFRMPAYIREANNNAAYTTHLVKLMRTYNKPPFSITRFVAQIIVGNSWCYLWVAAVPDEEIFGISLKPAKYLGPIAAALAVWLIGNIGREKGSLRLSVIGAFLVLPFAFINFLAINWSCVTSAIFFQWKAKQWQRTPMTKSSLCKRIFILLIGWLLFCSLWISLFYFNTEITTAEGEKVKLRDAVHNFFKSPMFLEFKKNMNKIYNDVWEHGWSQAWTNLVELIDPSGEQHALKVLLLPKGVTQEEITAQFKKLSKEWHPDRHKDPEKKIIAHNRFVEINEAYEKLSTLKKRRRDKSKISEDEDVYQETITI